MKRTPSTTFALGWSSVTPSTQTDTTARCAQLRGRARKWSRRRDSNPRPMLYESIALPLSYVGVNAGAEMATQQYINGLWGGSNRARSGSHGGDGPTWLR